MTSWLLDTNVISELRRPKPSRAVLAFIESQEISTLHVSAVTIAEIRYGIEIQTETARREMLASWLRDEIRPMFLGRVLPVDEDVMLCWRKLIGTGRRANQKFAQPDLIIAATALHHHMTIASRDKKGFVATTATLFDPWTEQAEG